MTLSALMGDQELSTPLVNLTLLKGLENGDAGEGFRFSGIASDEDQDVEGDTILRKALDLSYAQTRGYVNWDHSREPQDQLGFLTKCALIEPQQREELSKSFGVTVSKSASVFVQGELYKHVKKAQQVADIMRSTPSGQPGLGLSLDGMVARDVGTGGVVKAFVRGVAITPVPAHPKTLLQLQKSIQALAAASDSDIPGLSPEASEEVIRRVVHEVQQRLTKSVSMTHDEAVLYVLKLRPNWTFDLASKLVKYTMTRGMRS